MIWKKLIEKQIRNQQTFINSLGVRTFFSTDIDGICWTADYFGGLIFAL